MKPLDQLLKKDLKKIESSIPIPASEIKGSTPLPKLDGPGVYMWLHGKKVFYVGRTGKKKKAGEPRTLHERLREHLLGGKKMDNLSGQPIQQWLVKMKKAKLGVPVKTWMRENLKVKYVEIGNIKGDYPWERRMLLEHYLIAIYKPVINISKGQEH